MQNIDKTSRKITATLFASQSLFSAAMIMSFTVGSIILVEMAGGDNRWAGVPLTLMLIGAASMAYPMGRLMDRFGRRPGLNLAFFLGISGALLAGWAVIIGSIPLFLLGIFGLGLNRSGNELGRYAAAEASPVNKRARAISIVVFGGTVGSVGGPLLISWTSAWAEQVGLEPLSGAWFGAAFLLLIALGVLFFFLRPDPQTVAQYLAKQAPDLLPEEKLGRSIREILALPFTKIAVGAILCGQLAMTAVMTITPVHMHGHNHSIDSISLVIMAHTMGMFGMSFVTGWLVDKLGQIRMIVMGGLVLALACLLAPLWNTVAGLALSLFLLGLGWNFCFVSGSDLLSSIVRPGEKGRIQGLTDALNYVTSAVGSVSSGFALASVGFLVMSWFTILISLLPVLLVILFATTPQAPVMEGTPSS